MSKNHGFLIEILIQSYQNLLMSTLIYHFQNLVKALTCFENPDKPSPIDSVLTKFPKSFIDTPTVETGLLDFHKLRRTIFKMQKSKYKNFNIEKLQKFSE